MNRWCGSVLRVRLECCNVVCGGMKINITYTRSAILHVHVNCIMCGNGEVCCKVVYLKLEHNHNVLIWHQLKWIYNIYVQYIHVPLPSSLLPSLLLPIHILTLISR